MKQPLVKYYRPAKDARIRNPVTNELVPPYGQQVRSHFGLWAKRVRTGEAEEIKDEKAFLSGRKKVLDAEAAAAKKAGDDVAAAEKAAGNKGGDSPDDTKKGSK